MKTKLFSFKIAFIVTAMTLLSFTSYVNGQEIKESTDLTKNTELKNDVFNQIIYNKTLFNEFISDMMQNSQSMNWMLDNRGMMQYVFSDKNLGYLMYNQGMGNTVMRNMMNTIQSDSSFYNQWNQMMGNYPNNRMHQGMMMGY